MECYEKHVWTEYCRELLEQIQVSPPDAGIWHEVLKHWDTVAKPLDGMGKFETYLAQIGAILGTADIHLDSKAVIVMCADNGVVAEGISQTGQEVTLAVAYSMGRKQSSVGIMAEALGADTIPVNIGINHKDEIPGVLNRSIGCGTRNFHIEPAMTEEEVLRAIATGMDLVFDCKQKGYQLLALGEMGIGNTTTSSAVAAALLQVPAELVTGRGAGLSDAGLVRKRQVIAEAIEKYDLYHQDAFTIVRTVGGLDIAGLAGVCIGGAVYHIPVVLDGVISMVAALLAETMVPGTKDYLIPSHQGREPAMALLSEKLDMQPVIHGDLALGEGTGAVMMFSLLDLALKIYHTGSSFSNINVEQYQRHNQ